MTEKHEKIAAFLKECNDIEILDVINSINEEIKDRIISLFKENGCTCVEFSENDDAYVRVNNIYGTHGFDEDKFINVETFGVCSVYCGENNCPEVLYVITKGNEEFSGEEIDEDSLYDLYRTTKEKILTIKNSKK